MSTRRFQVLYCAVVVALLAGSLFAGCAPQEKRIARLTVLVSGNTLSYISNCGCALGQYGGYKRLARLARQELESALKPQPQDKGLPCAAVLIDVGNFADFSDQVSRINSDGVVEGMTTLPYAMVGLGLHELAYPQARLWDLLKDTDLPLTAANLTFTAPPDGDDLSAELNALIQPYRIAESADGYKTGLIHVIDQNVQDGLGKLTGFALTDGANAAQAILDEHRGEADYWLVSVADANRQGTSRDKLADLPGLMLVIGFETPTKSAERPQVEGAYPWFFEGPYTKSKDLVRVINVFKPEDVVSMEYDKLSIPDSIKADEQINEIIARLLPRLEQLEIDQASAAKAQDLRHPLYLGQESCRDCHAAVLENQLQTEHATALTTLVEIQQARNAECLPCHVVGHVNLPGVEWSGGWNVLDDQPGLRGVQCENCHGPGEYHVQLMESLELDQGVPPELEPVLMEEGRDRFGLLEPGDSACIVCHDELHSPDYEFEKYWEQIEHSEDRE
ncbi:hypothetical protein JW859_01400 [bacterium]|nr:hypothetical protein [bacterium]